jgi:hypothetical protein
VNAFSKPTSVANKRSFSGPPLIYVVTAPRFEHHMPLAISATAARSATVKGLSREQDTVKDSIKQRTGSVEIAVPAELNTETD